MTFGDTKIFFDCPIHGLEDQVFCWRASDKSLNERWVKYEVIYKKDDITPQEIEEMQKQISELRFL